MDYERASLDAKDRFFDAILKLTNAGTKATPLGTPEGNLLVESAQRRGDELMKAYVDRATHQERVLLAMRETIHELHVKLAFERGRR